MTKKDQVGIYAYLAVVFCNAFIDLGHKIVIQNTVFKVYDGSTQVILTAIINSLILLPFILLMTPSGYIADNYAKQKIMRVSAAIAIPLTLAITLCYAQGWFWAAFTMTLLLAVQSAFFSPAKYGYIKQLFGSENLANANGRVQAITIIAILSGTFAFSILFEWCYSETLTDKNAVLSQLTPLGWILVANAIVQFLFALRLPELEHKPAAKPFYWQSYLSGQALSGTIKLVASNRVIRQSIIGLAMFWSIGQVMLAGFPAFAKEHLDISNTVLLQGILAASGVGIALGSALAARWSKGHIETGFIALGAVGIAIGVSVITFLDNPTAQIINFLFIGTMGGFFIVPLNALIQFHARNDQMGRILASNNWIQNLCMFSFLLLTVFLASTGADSRILLIIIAGVAIAGSIYTIALIPQSLLQLLMMAVLRSRYRIAVQHIDNLPERGGVLLLGNHISWIDWAVIQIACPRPIKFVMLRSIYKKPYLTWLFKLFGCIPIESGKSRQALETIANQLNAGHIVCLFPEGTISRTGHLATFRKGYERACRYCHDDVLIIPFYLRGLWGSQFSRASNQLKQQNKSGWRREILIAFGKPLSKDTTTDILKRKVFELSISCWRDYVSQLPTLPEAWIDTVKHGNNNPISDAFDRSYNARKLFAGTLAIARHIKFLSPEQNIGVILPASSSTAMVNMATLLLNKTVVNLNYTASAETLLSALQQANIRTIYTSKLFFKKLNSKKIDLSFLTNADVELVYLEELATTITQRERIFYWLLTKLLPANCLRLLFCKANDPDATAAILFSSGSEGAPKGVMLSHRNIMANLKQIADVLNTQEDDVVLSSLPSFHAFGLTVTQFMPLIEGMPVICHPDPTDVFSHAKAIARYQATLLFGTSTFFRLYVKNKHIDPLMLDNLRLVVAGAERLEPQVRDAFKLKFGKTIYEGYGATETTPVASVNLPDVLDTRYWQVQQGCKPGTVGMPLPGSSCRIVDPNSREELLTGEDGMILIGGVQVMQGYLNNQEKTQEVIHTIDGYRWYVTGDKGHIDEDGFLSIVDRYSRFAKMGGEMISLSLVEQHIRSVIVDEAIHFVAVAVPDARKGEKIVVLTDAAVDNSEVKHQMLKQGCPPLSIPAQFYFIENIPVLGSGKTDFVAAKQIALQLSDNN